MDAEVWEAGEVEAEVWAAREVEAKVWAAQLKAQPHGRWSHLGRCHGGSGTPNEDCDFEELFQVLLCLMCV